MLKCDAGQIGYYHPGVGTMGARSALTSLGKWWTKVIGLAFGYGIADNIADAYQFLMRTFEPGDEIYIFGFSRGVYTLKDPILNYKPGNLSQPHASAGDYCSSSVNTTTTAPNEA